jgi:hypothetical protein
MVRPAIVAANFRRDSPKEGCWAQANKEVHMEDGDKTP